MFLLDLLVTATSYNIVAQTLSGILYHMHIQIYSQIYVHSFCFNAASVDIPVVNTQCKRSSQHIDMLHPYQWFISPLDHLHQW